MGSQGSGKGYSKAHAYRGRAPRRHNLQATNVTTLASPTRYKQAHAYKPATFEVGLVVHYFPPPGPPAPPSPARPPLSHRSEMRELVSADTPPAAVASYELYSPMGVL